MNTSKWIAENWNLLTGVAWVVLGTIAYDSAYESLGILMLMFGALTLHGRGRDTTIIIGTLEKEKQDESA